jgi:hypothetical protein
VNGRRLLDCEALCTARVSDNEEEDGATRSAGLNARRPVRTEPRPYHPFDALSLAQGQA